MQLRAEQLTIHLQKKLAPVFLISGEEPLLMQEACDAIRTAAHKAGFNEREIYTVDTHFNWQHFIANSQALSLFSSKQLIELRFTTHLPNDIASKALITYCEKLSPDKILLIITGKLDKKAQQTAWYQAVSKIGITVSIWPIENAQLPQWIAQRLQAAGLNIEPAGIRLLADYAEGNLLAAVQEITKLSLIHTKTQLTAEDIAQAITDNARFDVFNLTDAALQGDKKRITRIVDNLKAEAVEPTIILWALTREIRSLITQAHAITQGKTLDKVLQEQRVWEKRKPLIRMALQRNSISKLYNYLKHASKIDQIIKGTEVGNCWDEIKSLSLALSGIELYAA